MGSDRIFAEPSTITGSIGIFGLIPTIDQPLGKLGIHTDGVGTTPLAGAFRIDRPLTPEVKAIAQSTIERGYHEFITGVAKGRNLPVDKVDAMARGRVWSGAAAKDLGLVDEIGGLQDAERAAAHLAKLAPGAYHVEEMQPQRQNLARWVGRVLGDSHVDLGQLAGALPPQSGLREPAESALRLFRNLNDPLGEYAYCFCTPSMTAQLR
jgi:protease-4